MAASVSISDLHSLLYSNFQRDFRYQFLVENLYVNSKHNNIKMLTECLLFICSLILGDRLDFHQTSLINHFCPHYACVAQTNMCNQI